MKIDDLLNDMYSRGWLKRAVIASIISKEPINILIVGDPLTGKTSLLKEIARKFNHTEYFSCRSDNKQLADEFLKAFDKKKTLFLLDDVADLQPEDESILNGLMDKGISLIVVALPRHGRVKLYEPIYKQIDLKSNLIQKFDLTYCFSDFPDEKHDAKLADFVLGNPQGQISENDEIYSFIDEGKKESLDLLPESKEFLKKYYLNMRGSHKGMSDPHVTPITLKQLKTLIKLAKASAAFNKSGHVSIEDVKWAINVLEYSLMDANFNKEKGLIDIDMTEPDSRISDEGKLDIVRQIIDESLNNKLQVILYSSVISEAVKKGLSQEEAEQTIDDLHSKGEIFDTKERVIDKV